MVVVDGDECVLVVGAAVGDGEMADVDIGCVYGDGGSSVVSVDGGDGFIFAK